MILFYFLLLIIFQGYSYIFKKVMAKIIRFKLFFIEL